MSGWVCRIPFRWGHWLASEHGPLATERAGVIAYDGSTATLDQAAFDILARPGAPGEGRIVWQGDTPHIAFDPERFPVHREPPA